MPDFSKYDEIEAKVSSKLKDLRTEETKHITASSKYNMFKREHDKELHIPGTLDCPHCSNEFVLGEGGTSTVDDIKKEHENHKVSLSKEMSGLKNVIDASPDFNAEREKLSALTDQLKVKKTQDLNEYSEAQSKIAQISQKKSQLEQLKISLEGQLSKNKDTLTKLSKIELDKKKLTQSYL